jgi:hypothetical protein
VNCRSPVARRSRVALPAFLAFVLPVVAGCHGASGAQSDAGPERPPSDASTANPADQDAGAIPYTFPADAEGASLLGSCPGWSWTDPLPQGNDLNGVWGVGSADVWAVGANGTVVHWNGSEWSTTGAASNSGTTSYLQDVWGSGSNDVWAVGSAGTVVRWNGSGWVVSTIDARSTLSGVWGSGPNDVWAVGYFGGDAFEAGAYGTLAHWNGIAWSTSTVPTDGGIPVDASLHGFHGVWGSGPGDVWVVGDRGAIEHWDGGGWTDTGFGADSGVQDSLLSVWGSGPGDVWAVGGGTFAHWNGTSWAQVAPPVSAHFDRVWGTGSSDVWAAGPGGVLAHWNGSAWSTSAVPGATLSTFRGVWGNSAGDVWTVGAAGAIARWNGSAWSLITSQVAAPVGAVWGTGPSDVWAVGNGAILHWDGSMWTAAPPAVDGLPGARAVDSLNLYGLWGTGSNDIWAVGFDQLPIGGPGGIAVHWNGSVWSASTAMSVHLSDVWGSATNDIWGVGLVGGAGTGGIVHWNGSAWSPAVLPPASTNVNDLYGVWGNRADDVWAVGTGTILHWDGQAWSAAASGVALEQSSLTSVWGSGPNDVWAVGYGVVAHWNGSAWSFSGTDADGGATTESLHQVWGSGPTDVWAVGTVSAAGGQAPQATGGSVIRHWDGRAWSVCTANVNALRGVWGSGPSDVWTVGANAILHHR